MDADGRIIPYVDDDQGEGVKDPLTMDDLIAMRRSFYDAMDEVGAGELFRHIEKQTREEYRKNKEKATARWELPKQFNRHR